MDLPPDVLRYVDENYPGDERIRILSCLVEIGTPRVVRSVLYLANGSATMLQHYFSEAQNDIRDIVVAAEYETQVSATPMRLRDMSQPFDHDENLGSFDRKGPKRGAPKRVVHHQEILGECFALGDVRYVVRHEQPSPTHVYLRRHTGEDSRVVRLPRLFVLEQLAESIELVS